MTKISELAAASALSGTELVPVVQGGVTERTTAQDIADLAPSGTTVRTLGYAENTSLSQDVTTLADVTSLSVAVTVPASARIKITAFVQMASSNAAGDRVRLRIREGATTLQQSALGMTSNAQAEGVTAIWSGLPSTGAHTYKVSAERADGDGTITASSGATVPAFILVEDIT